MVSIKKKRGDETVMEYFVLRDLVRKNLHVGGIHILSYSTAGILRPLPNLC